MSWDDIWYHFMLGDIQMIVLLNLMGYLVDLSNNLLKMLCFEFLSNISVSKSAKVRYTQRISSKHNFIYSDFFEMCCLYGYHYPYSTIHTLSTPCLLAFYYNEAIQVHEQRSPYHLEHPRNILCLCFPRKTQGSINISVSPCS